MRSTQRRNCVCCSVRKIPTSRGNALSILGRCRPSALIAELERLQEFLKSETGRVQREIESVLDGIGIIIEAIAPWKTAGLTGAPNVHAHGRDKLKRWP